MRNLTILLLIPVFILAQDQYKSGSMYNPSVPTPASVLGYEPGTRFSDFRNLERFFTVLDASSDRMQRIEYGMTYEKRPLQLFVISAPANLARLDEIKSANARLTNPRLSEKEGKDIAKGLPGIVWLSYGVHGNEASSPEAAMMTAYQLCAGTDARTTALLDSIIVLMDPSVNPDGRERYVSWINATLGSSANPNPDAIEHDEPWPGGRVNHYYFDLNRDWAWATQKETQARLKLYREWMPHVHVDFHEMWYGSTYFFFPAAPPFHSGLPQEVKKWGAIYGKGNASAFDALGIPYYTGESFDLFYPGYGDSWPTFNGAVGMTYEQAGHSMGGLAVRKPGGEILTLRERATNHFVSSMATLETTLRHREERIRDFTSFWETGMRSAPPQTYVIKESPDPIRAAHLSSILLRQGIEVHRLEKDATMTIRKFFSNRQTRESLPAGTYLVSLQQSHRRLAAALLEPSTAPQDTFFYDVSAWSLPVAYGLQAFVSESGLPPGAVALKEPPRIQGIIHGGKGTYAYLIPWERQNAFTLVWKLIERGFSLSFATRPLSFPSKTFQAGTVIAFQKSNPDSLYPVLEKLASQTGVDVFSTNTGLTDRGIDLGSNYVRPLMKPRIAVVTGDPVSPNDYGELWYMFDHEYQIPFTALRAKSLGEARLDQYSAIILPDGRNYQQVFDSSTVARLKRWVDEGGVLIGIEEGARFLTKRRSGMTSALLESDRKDDDKTKEEKEEEKKEKERLKHLSLFEKEESDRLRRIPGTIFRALIDTTHPIGFGYDRETFVFKGNGPSFLLSESGHTAVRFAPDTVSVSGYLPKNRGKRIADSGFVLDFHSGSGRVVLFAENVTFRMFWKGHQRLLLNALFFLPERD